MSRHLMVTQEQIIHEACTYLAHGREVSIRKLAKMFGRKRSSVHNDLVVYLPRYNKMLADSVKYALKRNRKRDYK